MTEKTDSKEREALIRAITSMCHDMDNDKIIITRREGEGPALRQLLDAMQRELASLAANAGSEPVAWVDSWTNDQWIDLAQRHANADWDSDTPDGYLNAVKALCNDFAAANHSPPEGMVGGWIAEKEPPCKD